MGIASLSAIHMLNLELGGAAAAGAAVGGEDRIDRQAGRGRRGETGLQQLCSAGTVVPA